jgi:cysteinyl-tRNA synthetase
MTIRLWNTRTRRDEDFVPLDPANVRMYVCGPTVYDRAHLGNARPVVVFDVLNRLLRHVYGDDHVTYVRNFTDVDDKINAEALRRRGAGAEGTLEELIRQRTDETIAWYHADMDALGAMRPDHEPRATEYIGPMVAMIVDLIAKGHAYAAEGHVLFRVRSYAAYGGLSGRTVDDMIAGARVEVAPFKEDPMDFVLWKPSDGETPGWDSPWGRGRPGWHIECSAMSHELLGASFDIHGGGIDLQFPHHENEIAQSACAHPEADFARYWLHNEMLLVEGKKMSKSLGNFFTVRDLLDQGVPGEVIRLVLLTTHYRKPTDWTLEKAKQAEATLDWLYSLVGDEPFDERWPAHDRVVAALSDDLNTNAAFSELVEFAKTVPHRNSDMDPGTSVAELKRTAHLLGFLQQSESEWLAGKEQTQAAIADAVAKILDIRSAAREAKDWPKSDKIRTGFRQAGIRITDTAQGPQWEIAKGEIDTIEFFHRVRSAFSSGDGLRLEQELMLAKEAGIHFSQLDKLDVSPAWIGFPSEGYVKRMLTDLLKQVS